MARGLRRGDVWLVEFRSPDKRRPVVVMSRAGALATMNTVIVIPITSRIRGIPSEVVLGVEDGLKGESAANFDHVKVIEQARLTRCVGRVRDGKLEEMCRALAFAVGCSNLLVH